MNLFNVMSMQQSFCIWAKNDKANDEVALTEGSSFQRLVIGGPLDVGIGHLWGSKQ